MTPARAAIYSVMSRKVEIMLARHAHNSFYVGLRSRIQKSPRAVFKELGISSLKSEQLEVVLVIFKSDSTDWLWKLFNTHAI